MRKSKFCKIQGMLEVLMVHTACYLARLYEYNTNCPMSKVSKEIKKLNHYIRLPFKKFICHVKGV